MTLPTDEISADLQTLSNLYNLQAILVQIQSNLTLIGTGAAGQVIVVNGVNLYELAAQYYGDATLWTTIAKANGLTDPQLPAGTPISLVIPSQTNDTQGIYQS